jgi:hypothetical protein
MTALAVVVLVGLAAGVSGAAGGTEPSSTEPGYTPGQPDLTTSESTIQFGTINTSDHATRTVTITNDSPTSVNVSGTRLEGDTDVFSLTEPAYLTGSDSLGGQTVTVPPGLSQEVTVAFDPNAPGEYSASLSVLDENGDEVASVTATGTASGPGSIRVRPASLTFEGTTVNSTATRTVTVTNEGGRSLDVTDTAIRGSSAYSLRDGGSFAVAPGESDDLTVAFSPMSTATHTGLLEIRSDDPTRPVVAVSLSSSDIQTRVTTRDRGLNRTVNVAVQDARAGQAVDITVPSPSNESSTVDVEEISVTPERDGDLSLNVTDSDEPLGTTPSLDTGDNTTGLRYLSVNHSIPNDEIAQFQYRYRVRKDRVERITTGVDANTSANPAAITMYRYVEGEWREQNTTYLGESGEYYRYVTNASGASEWTAAAKRPDIRILEANASVSAARVGETVAIQVQLTNDGGADGVFVTRLLLNGSVVEERTVTVPNGGTIPVSFERPFEEAGNYRVTVNQVSVGTITINEAGQPEVSSPGESEQETEAQDESAGDESGLSPMVLGILGVIGVIVLGGLGAFVRSDGDDDTVDTSTDSAEESVVQIEGIGDESGEEGSESAEAIEDGDTTRSGDSEDGS